MIDFPISGNDFRISEIDFPISGNVLDFPISGNQFPISENRHPTEAGHSATLQHRPTTPPPINNGPQLYQSDLLVDLYGPTYTTSVNRSVQPTIIIQPMISLKNAHKQRVLMHRHQGWNVRHGLCHIYTRYLYIWVVYSFCLFCCLFIIVTWWYMWCIVWQVASKRKACLVTLWLFIISCHSLYKTTLGSLCSWKPAWSLKKRPHSMCLKPFVKMCIFVVIQIFWSLRKYWEQ